MEPLLAARDIFQTFFSGRGNTEVLRGVSLNLYPGEMIMITGPSGAGKTTLLHLLGGLARPTAGEIHFAGQSLSKMDDRQLAHIRNTSFGYIFQTPHLLHDRTVLENVALPFVYGKRESKDAIDTRCRSLLEYVGLQQLAHRYPANLSGGEMQRLVFARALVRNPQIIFADEPTGSLDVDNSNRILELLQDQIRQGASVIHVTHDPSLVGRGQRQLHMEKA